MNPAVYGSVFFGVIVLYILYTLLQCWWMEASSLYSGLSITITHSFLLEPFPSWLLGWALVWWREKDHYTGPHLFGFIFSRSKQNIYGQTQKCIAKNHRLSFLAGQICTRSGARFLLTRKIKKRFSLWHTIDVMRDDANGIYSSKYKGNTCIFDGK